MKIISIFILVAVGNIHVLRAQITTNYTFSDSNGVYSEITGGTVLAKDTNGNQSYNSLDIGFTFRYNEINYTKFSVNTDGFIVLGPVAKSTYQAISSTADNSNVIAAFSTNLSGGDLAMNQSELGYETIGTAPDRVLVIQWKNFTEDGAAANQCNYNFQIRLFETSNLIQCMYGPMVKGGSVPVGVKNVQVGIRGRKADDFQNRATTTDWSATTAGTQITATCSIGKTVIPPPPGLTFTWTPNARPVTYSSSTTVQKDTLGIDRGMTNCQIICLQIEVSGNSGAPINLTGVKLNNSGSTNFQHDVTKVKIFTTGLSNTFTTTTLFGETTGIDSLITGSVQLVAGANTNYFWITYDISPDAKVGDTLDAQCVSINLSGSGGTQIPVVTDPPGSKIISPWRRKADFPGTARNGAVGFSIGNKCYIGLGISLASTYLKDFWEYDVQKNAWKKLNDFLGTARSNAVGFSIAGKGYVGTGVEGNAAYDKDFWEYDPTNDTWIPLSNFPGDERGYSVGFSIGKKGYVGTGGNGVSPTLTIYNDFWEFDPRPDSTRWRQRTNLPASERAGAIGFALGTKGYVGSGAKTSTGNDSLLDFYEFNPDSNLWNRQADVPKAIQYGVAFSVGSKAYVGTGLITSQSSRRDLWIYDPASTTWTQTLSFPGEGREKAVGVSINNEIGFVSTGSGSGNTNDIWMIQNGNIPKAQFSLSATSVCNGDIVNFIDSSTGPVTSWQWSFPGGTPSTSSAQHPVVQYNTAGTYNVTLIAIGGDGDDTLRKENFIVVNPLPEINAGPDITICPPDTDVNLSASGVGAVSYTWSPADGLSCTNCKTTNAHPKTTTTYIVEGTSVNGCKARDTVVITIASKVVATARKDGDVCKGEKTQLHASGGTSYSWNPVDSLDNPHIADPTAGPSKTITYTVTVSSGSCVKDSASVTVAVHPNPPVPIITQYGTTLHSDPAKGYQWYRNDILIVGATSETYTPTQNGNYNVVVTDSNGCSSTSAPKQVTVGVRDNEKEVRNVMLGQNHPNPFSQLSVVSYSRSAGSDERSGIFEVRDMLGRVMYRTHVGKNSTEVTIDAGGWSNGLYLYSLNDGKNIESHMMMVVH